MARVLLALLAALLFVRPVHTAEIGLNDCFRGLALLSPDDPYGENLVATTYRQLLEALGNRLTPETLLAVKKNGTPFDIPEQKGTDLDGLRSKMKSFETLVRERGWDTPEVHARLLTEIDGRVAALGVATEKRDTADKATWNDFPVALPRANEMLQSPDGRFLVSTNCPAGTKGPWTVNVFDRTNNTLTEVPGGTDYHADPFFSPDGTELRFPMQHDRFKIVPFHDGKLDWAKARTLGTAPGQNWPRDYQQGQRPHLFVAGYHPHAQNLFDTKNNRRTPVNFAEYLRSPGTNHPGAKDVRSWGFVPGTDDLFLLYSDDTTKKAYIKTVTLSETGVLQPKDVRGYWKYKTNEHHGPDPYRATFTLDGKKIFLWGGNAGGSLTLLESPNVTPRTLFIDGGKINDRVEVNGVKVNPKNGDVAVVYSFPFSQRPRKYEVQILDPHTLEKKGEFALPGNHSSVEFSVDGQTILANDLGNEVMVINYQQKTN